jgi:hypothetical protein
MNQPETLLIEAPLSGVNLLESTVTHICYGLIQKHEIIFIDKAFKEPENEIAMLLIVFAKELDNRRWEFLCEYDPNIQDAILWKNFRTYYQGYSNFWNPLFRFVAEREPVKEGRDVEDDKVWDELYPHASTFLKEFYSQLPQPDRPDGYPEKTPILYDED